MGSDKISDTDSSASVVDSTKSDVHRNRLRSNTQVGFKLPKRNEVIVTDVERHDMIPRYREIMLPDAVRRLHGCTSCEWRGTDECPFGFSAGKIFYSGRYQNVCCSDSRGYRICVKRENYLRSCVLHDEQLVNGGTRDASTYTYSRWLQAYLLSMKTHMTAMEYQNYTNILNEVAEITNKFKAGELTRVEYKKELRELNIDLRKIKNSLSIDYNDVMRYVDKQIERDTPKHIDMNINKTVKVEDIQKIVRLAESGEVVDADYDLIDEGKK